MLRFSLFLKSLRDIQKVHRESVQSKLMFKEICSKVKVPLKKNKNKCMFSESMRLFNFVK